MRNRILIVAALLALMGMGIAMHAQNPAGAYGSINASTLNGATFASPGPIGGSAPSTGSFSQVSVVSGVVISNSLLQIGGPAATHITQGVANSDVAGKLTCATSTVTKTFSSAFTSTPVVIVFDETTKGGANLTAISNSAFTVSCTGATDALDYLVIGNNN